MRELLVTIGRRRLLGLGLAAAFGLAALGGSASGLAEASIDGRVVDEAGAPLPNAVVSVQSPDLPDGEANTSTDAQGVFHLAPVRAGLYDLTVELEGFRRGERRDLLVEEGRAAQVEIKLERRGPGEGGY